MTTLAITALNCAKQLGRVNSDGTAIIDLETEIKDEIKQAIRNFNRKPWHLLENRAFIITTVNGVKWYSAMVYAGDSADGVVVTDDTIVLTGFSQEVPVADILKIQYIRENQSSLQDGLTEISYDYFERLQDGTAIGGAPIFYTRYGEQIGVYPTPAGEYTLNLSATVKATIPTADNDTSIWLTEANELIEAAACSRVCLKYLRDRERAQEFASIAQGAQDVLHAEYVRKSATGRIRPHD